MARRRKTVDIVVSENGHQAGTLDTKAPRGPPVAKTEKSQSFWTKPRSVKRKKVEAPADQPERRLDHVEPAPVEIVERTRVVPAVEEIRSETVVAEVAAPAPPVESAAVPSEVPEPDDFVIVRHPLDPPVVANQILWPDDAQLRVNGTPVLLAEPPVVPPTPPANGTSVTPAAESPLTAFVTSVTAPPPPVPAAPPPATPPAAPRSEPHTGPLRLGDLLVAENLITAQELDHALAEQVSSGQRLGSELVRLGMITERQLMETLAQQLHIPVADLRMTAPEPAALARLPEAVARRLEVMPLRIIGDVLEIALADALNDHLRADLEAASGGPVAGVLAPPSEIRQALDRAYLVISDVNQSVATFQALESSRPRAEVKALEVDDNAPVVQVVTLLLTQAVRDRASDIHLEPQGDQVRVRFRVDGVMREITTLPEEMAQSLVSRIKVMADMNIVERRRPQDGQITTDVDGRPLDIRVSTLPTIFGEKAVLRLLDKTRGLLTLGDLGMTPAISETVADLVTSPFGMVICAGPTGSGKTTTLYAALQAIESPTRNVTTIEDPVEYVVPSINQIQVNNLAGVTFADGLRSILRQDPDVILVGEIRDVETARIAVQSALTGHLVLSSVHATDSATAIQRFRDMGIEPFLVTSSVLAVISQRLVRRICPHCREPYDAPASERTFFQQGTGRAKDVYWHGVGCNLCSHTGYSHRIGIYELLKVSDGIKDLIIADAGYEAIRSKAIGEGMRTLQDEVLQLVSDDVTTIAEAARTVFVH